MSEMPRNNEPGHAPGFCFLCKHVRYSRRQAAQGRAQAARVSPSGRLCGLPYRLHVIGPSASPVTGDPPIAACIKQRGEVAMLIRLIPAAAMSLAVCVFSGAAAAQTWNPEQQEIWKVEQQQWKMAAAEDLSWIDTMVHQNLRFWETGAPMPRDKASLKHWSRFDADNGSTLEQELFPISVTITGNIAVVQYKYMIARENNKKERETVTGHYTDVLVKDGGRWLFLAWEGGDDPKK
jgi:hypothetical protein